MHMSKQWAQRKNTVTCKLLQAQFQHLEQRYHKVHQQHLRDKNRIHSQLEDLKNTLHGSSNEIVSPRKASLTEHKDQMGDEMTDGWAVDSSKNALSCSETISHTHRECKYGSTPTGYPCHYFPCETPKTYNTIGYIRSDTVPWISLKYKTTLPGSEINNRISIFPKRDSRDLEIVQLNAALNVRNKFCNSSEFENINQSSVPRWSPNNKSQQIQLQTIKGPLFEPKPPDQVLEKVRRGSVEPVLVLRSTSRPTVRDRIRRLKRVISEMRAKNNKVKPQDWAINYGQKVPAKKLLKPVAPNKMLTS